MPSSSSSTAGIISCRGCARVPSQAEIATVCPGRTRSRSGGPDDRLAQRAAQLGRHVGRGRGAAPG